MNNFKKVIEKLNRLEKGRPEPEDMFNNIISSIDGENLNEEEWCNFFRYITSQNREEFTYLPRSEITTLGDLGDEKLAQIQETLDYGEDQSVEYIQNGIETRLFVKNVPSIIKNNDGKFMDGACEKIPSLSQGGITKNRPPRSIEDIPQGLESESSSEDEKQSER